VQKRCEMGHIVTKNKPKVIQEIKIKRIIRGREKDDRKTKMNSRKWDK